jgi:RPE5 domain-containing protein
MIINNKIYNFISKLIKNDDELHLLDDQFISYLSEKNLDLANYLLFHRDQIDTKEMDSDSLIELATIFEEFILIKFGIKDYYTKLNSNTKTFEVIYQCRRLFIQRYALKKYKSVPQEELLEVSKQIFTILNIAKSEEIDQFLFAQKALFWLENEELFAEELKIASYYAIFQMAKNTDQEIFRIPKYVDHHNLIRQERIRILQKKARLGFDYQDQETEYSHHDIESFMASKYCIYCHKQKKDSCRTGIKDQLDLKGGCPLEQKISEMNLLYSKGYIIASMAMVSVDNPLFALTGHRICNDCMQACIFQKQDPVNIPMIESNILEKILQLPLGLEIYLLFTRWNPLKIKSYLPKSYSNYKVAVVGLGPAGIAASYYLLHLGHQVVAFEGARIVDVNFNISAPIYNWRNITTELSKRDPYGFGGVAEYGITNRWQKNNLLIMRIMLERHANYHQYDSIKIGSNITLEELFISGIDHAVLAMGSGKPKVMQNILLNNNNISTANSFLMQSQLSYRSEFLLAKNLLRFPLVVVGLGLTAIDCAMQALHYYKRQLDMLYELYNLLQKEKFYAQFPPYTHPDIKIMLEHAALVNACSNHQEMLNIISGQQTGGVTIIYHRNIPESSAYKQNYSEIEHALAMGINILENTSLKQVEVDDNGNLRNIILGDDSKIEARTLLTAIGTARNEQIFNNANFDNKNFDNANPEVSKIDTEDTSEVARKMSGEFAQALLIGEHKRIPKFDNANPAVSKVYTIVGDCNPKYAGSVVKAIASAKNLIPEIQYPVHPNKVEIRKVLANLDRLLKSQVKNIKFVSDTSIEITIESKGAFNNFALGQIFRVQFYHEQLIQYNFAISGTYLNTNNSDMTFLILHPQIARDIKKHLRVGDYISVVGPVGSPYPNINASGDVLIIGGGFVDNSLVKLLPQIRSKNTRIIYIAEYLNDAENIYEKDILESIDFAVYIYKEQPTKATNTATAPSMHDALEMLRDKGLLCNISDVFCHLKPGELETMPNLIKQYLNNQFDNANPEVANIYTADTSEVARKMSGELAERISIREHKRIPKFDNANPEVSKVYFHVGLITSMHCMMEGVCGKCITYVPQTKEYVFACSQNRLTFEV